MYAHTRLLNDSWKIELESFLDIIFGRKFGENVEKNFSLACPTSQKLENSFLSKNINSTQTHTFLSVAKRKSLKRSDLKCFSTFFFVEKTGWETEEN